MNKKPPAVDAAILWYYEEILEAVEHPLPTNGLPIIDCEELMDVLGSIAIVHYHSKEYSLILLNDLAKFVDIDSVTEALTYYQQWVDVQALRKRWSLPTSILIECVFILTNITLTKEKHGKQQRIPDWQETESRREQRSLPRRERTVQRESR